MPGRHLTDCQVRRYMNLRTKGPAVGGCGRRQGGVSTATGYRSRAFDDLDAYRRLIAELVDDGRDRQRQTGDRQRPEARDGVLPRR